MSYVVIKAVVVSVAAVIGASYAFYTYLRNNRNEERDHRATHSTAVDRNYEYTRQSSPEFEEDTSGLKCKHCKTSIVNEEIKRLRCKSIFHANCIAQLEVKNKHDMECRICRSEDYQ